MEYITEILVGILIAIIGVFFRFFFNRISWMTTRVDELSNEVKDIKSEMDNEMNNMKIKLADQYTTKQEFMRYVDTVMAKIDQSNEKLDDKITKIYEKFDDLVNKLNEKKDKRDD